MKSYNIPESTLETLLNYRDHRLQPGSFVRAVLANDLFKAMERGDAESIAALPEIVKFIYWEFPGNIWGSFEAIRDHLNGLDKPAAS
jgi:hypothetical protein